MSDKHRQSCTLVTGATGFIGRRLIDALRQQPGMCVRALVRDATSASRIWPAAEVTIVGGDLTRPGNLSAACRGVDTVFHLAGYAHANGINEDKAAELHNRITVAGTQALMAAAADAGVKRLVFVSSVKAMGEGSDVCLDESSQPAPESPYGKAKLAAECLVLAAGQGMHVCVLRLPLVYGHDNKGNLPRMIAAIDNGRFPPVPETGNRRSMVHVDDVIQALLLAVRQHQANRQVYIVTDEQAYSTRKIYEMICTALGRPVARWSVPVVLMRLLARLGDLIGTMRGRPFFLNRDVLHKLVGSACYSSAKIRQELGYRPVHNLENALPEMVSAYRQRSAEG